MKKILIEEKGRVFQAEDLKEQKHSGLEKNVIEGTVCGWT